ncbi:hypothetical protein TWF281_010146 [Arthrobotrys megalospora]
MPAALRRTKSSEELETDFRKALNVADYKTFIRKYISKKNDIRKLNKFYQGHTDAEYKEMLGRLADKLTNMIEGEFPHSFAEAVDIVEKEERDIIKEKEKASNDNNSVDGSPNAPNTPLDPPVSSASADPKSAHAVPTGQPEPSTPGDKSLPSSGNHGLVPAVPAGQPSPPTPTNQQASPATGKSAAPPGPQNALKRHETASTEVGSVFSHGKQSSSGSVTTTGTASHGNNAAQDEANLIPSLPPQEELEREYAAYAEDFIRRNFNGLLDPDSPDFKDMMRTAAKKAKEIMEKYDITPEDAKKLTKLALYDFAILCDDSWSMMPDENEEEEDRITPLKETLGRISELATIIEPSGISVRFLNYENDDMGWDNLISREFIENQWGAVEDDWGGITQLGKKVDEKIIQPMVIQKMRKGTFKKPLIVVAITDGAPTGEPDDAFKDAIIRCKTSKEVVGYGEAAVIFIISRVGSDKYARRFLSGLRRNKELSEWVYCSKDRLDDNAAVMKRAAMIGEAQGNKEYAKKLLQIFLAALGQQTK